MENLRVGPGVLLVMSEAQWAQALAARNVSIGANAKVVVLDEQTRLEIARLAAQALTQKPEAT